jgi:hypothetical protein
MPTIVAESVWAEAVAGERREANRQMMTPRILVVGLRRRDMKFASSLLPENNFHTSQLEIRMF